MEKTHRNLFIAVMVIWFAMIVFLMTVV